jgi:hypothetical protein
MIVYDSLWWLNVLYDKSVLSDLLYIYNAVYKGKRLIGWGFDLSCLLYDKLYNEIIHIYTYSYIFTYFYHIYMYLLTIIMYMVHIYSTHTS